MIEKPKKGRGGSRPGAGRKTGSLKKVVIADPKPTVGYQVLVKPFFKQKEVALSPSATATSRGFLILALGNSMYGKMAANLAASIKFNDKNMPVCLVYSEQSISHLTAQHKALFSHIIECPKQYYTKNGRNNYFKAKTRFYDLSPFDETICCDADMLFFGGKNLNQLFAELSKRDFVMQCRGEHDFTSGTTTGKYTFWCNLTEAKRQYPLSEKIFMHSSEFVFFKKGAFAKKLFALAKKIFDNPKVNSSIQFAGDIPDELAFNLAASVLNIQPRSAYDVFVYWALMDKGVLWSDAVKNYYALSIGGNNVPMEQFNRYHHILKHQSELVGLPYYFKAYAKKAWDKNRIAV